jgi:hypothetical protein
VSPDTETPRTASGKYAKHPACECCGKPAQYYCSDDETLRVSAAGLVLCERVRCEARRDALDVTRRVDLYTRQAVANCAALARGENPPLVPICP